MPSLGLFVFRKAWQAAAFRHSSHICRQDRCNDKPRGNPRQGALAKERLARSGGRGMRLAMAAERHSVPHDLRGTGCIALGKRRAPHGQAPPKYETAGSSSLVLYWRYGRGGGAAGGRYPQPSRTLVAGSRTAVAQKPVFPRTLVAVSK